MQDKFSITTSISRSSVHHAMSVNRLENWLDGLQTEILPEKGFRLAGVTLIDRAELELFGQTYPEPVRMEKQDLAPTWK